VCAHSMLAGSGDKNVKIWGLDFGDCHRSMFAHDGAVTAIKFMPNTHYFFSGGKDGRLEHLFERVLLVLPSLPCLGSPVSLNCLSFFFFFGEGSGHWCALCDHSIDSLRSIVTGSSIGMLTNSSAFCH
jgi:WD40 repeat protein